MSNVANKSNPILSIGMIFKNEIRCLERCMESLAPLREAVPCELVMADTGSSDGSREIAEKYADLLFDFPWTDDFSAARNAVMDRCSGQWFLTVDSDEYLDGDISELVDFLRGRDGKKDAVCAAVVQRNYLRRGSGDYSDFYAPRLLRMSTGMRYRGAIHEYFPFPEERPVKAKPLGKTILHHDGYIDLYNSKTGEEKRKRNLELLRKELEREPENLRYLMQFLESAHGEPDYNGRLYLAVSLLERECKGWRTYGPPIIRYAVREALSEGFPEMEDWLQWAESQFPGSCFVRIDAAYCAAFYYWDTGKYQECIGRCEAYLQGVADYRAHRGQISELLVSALTQAGFYQEQNIRLILAGAYAREKRPEDALALLTALDWKTMDEQQIPKACSVLEHVLLSGVRFPPTGRPINLEEMDMLAGRLDSPRLAVRAVNGDFAADWPSLLWARGLALAGVQSCEWDDEETGLELAGAFAKIEREFLPRYYAAELLCDENIHALPPMHRFGWYCGQAFDALDKGDAVQYVRLLQKGLTACPGMKNMVEFLSGHTPELQPQKPSGELLALAEKVRMMLSAYAPDDPAVVMIKSSPVYQKVAHLIEGPEVGLFGGLAQ